MAIAKDSLFYFIFSLKEMKSTEKRRREKSIFFLLLLLLYFKHGKMCGG
jgi:hypothetical protein